MSPETGKPTILVVDDDPTVLKLVQTVLQTNGYEVLTANEAPKGLEIAMKQSPDLIILDVMMPIINGFNICRLIKSEKKCRHIPVMLLTSRSSSDDQKIGTEVGADGYIGKPFRTEELLQRTKELLSAQLKKKGESLA